MAQQPSEKELIVWLKEQTDPAFPTTEVEQQKLANCICKVLVPNGIGMEGECKDALTTAIEALGYSPTDAGTIAGTVSAQDRQYAYSYEDGKYIVVVIITTLE